MITYHIIYLVLDSNDYNYLVFTTGNLTVSVFHTTCTSCF